MKTKSNFLKMSGLLLSAWVGLFCISPLTAAADDKEAEETPCSLTLDCQIEEKPIVGELFKLYLIADNVGGGMSIASDFADVGFLPSEIDDIEEDTASQLTAFATTLEEYIAQQEKEAHEIEPVAEDFTDSNGKIDFNNLEEGVYLLVGAEMTDGDTTYTPVASLISLPYVDTDHGDTDYSLIVFPKIEMERPTGMTAVSNNTIVPSSTTTTTTNTTTTNRQRVTTDVPTITTTVTPETTLTDPLLTTTTTSTSDLSTTSTTDSSLSSITSTSGSSTTIVTTKPSQGLPQTGQLKWPILALSSGGLILFAMGYVLQKNNSDSDKK
jgi:hypothetical protein